MEQSPAVPFAWSSPYGGCWAEKYYREAGGKDLYGIKVITAKQLNERLGQNKEKPGLFFMGNFVVDRRDLEGSLDALSINRVHTEDGFFPHYQSLHLDPVGFCWESSLTKMPFEGCSDKQRKVAEKARLVWLRPGNPKRFPSGVRRPFVLWPLQLLGDRVNRHGLAASTWVPYIEHFRKELPPGIQLVVKAHPKGGAIPDVIRACQDMPNTIVIRRNMNLQEFLKRCCGCAGMNSTVLMEARLMYFKPTWAYGDSWFTGHADLISPLSLEQHVPNKVWSLLDDPAPLKKGRSKEYTDWFLAQLLARQVLHVDARQDAEKFVQTVDRLSRRSYVAHGWDIFE